VFRGDKTRTRVEGTVRQAEGLFAGLNGVPFEGYEIHMGETTAPGGTRFAALTGSDGEKNDGVSQGNVWGSYVHGIFDRAEFARAVVNCLLRAKGLPEEADGVDWDVYKEQQYDKLADGVRRSMDMERVYRILEGKE
jgi:adenosylcobyric acid synthase